MKLVFRLTWCCVEPIVCFPKTSRRRLLSSAMFPAKAVITARDVDNIYEVPLALHSEGLDTIICEDLNLPASECRIESWQELVETIKNPEHEVTIGIVGKYIELEDSYKSLNEALLHGGLPHRARVNLKWVESEGLVGEDWQEKLAAFRWHPGAWRFLGRGGLKA